MLKEIVFTTLEDQARQLRAYTRSLTPLERLAYLYQLNLCAFGRQPASNAMPLPTIQVLEIEFAESLEEFLRRKNKS